MAGAVLWEPAQGRSLAPQVFTRIAARDARQKSPFACHIVVSERGHLKHKLLEKSKSGVKGKSEGESLFHSCLEQPSHTFGLLGFEVKALLLFFILSLFFKYSILSLVLRNCFLLQGTEKDFCGREDVTTGNS